MALHPVRLPPEAKRLFRYVVLIKRLLYALADQNLVAANVNEDWVKAVWSGQPDDWVHQFCLRGQLKRIQAVAAASHQSRQALAQAFAADNHSLRVFNAGGHYTSLTALAGFDNALQGSVSDFFMRCFELLGEAKFLTAGSNLPSKSDYKEAFAKAKSVVAVCPYCDESLGTSKLDHYYAKSRWPLLAISPWNLIPVCNSCNELNAKADRPALTAGAAVPASDWLHPIHRPAGTTAVIELSGPPTQPAPSLASPDATENTRLANHFSLIRTLGSRWTRTASSYFDSLVRKTSQQLGKGMSLSGAVQDQLNEHEASRGLEACSMTKAAVCRAVLSGRAEYVAEFSNFNPPQLN